ncbi:hypothetical protein HZB89_01455 [archaeon]|nr:hypothetical protein [archaeon]
MAMNLMKIIGLTACMAIFLMLLSAAFAATTTASPRASIDGNATETTGMAKQAIKLKGRCTSDNATISGCAFSLYSATGCTLSNESQSGLGTNTAYSTANLACTSKGSKKIILTAQDAKGESKSVPITISVSETTTKGTNAKPAAGYNGSATTGKVNQAIKLKGTCVDSDGTIDACGWTTVSGNCSLSSQTKSGIGTATATNSATLKCTSSGSKMVQLKAQDNSKATGYLTLTISVK